MESLVTKPVSIQAASQKNRMPFSRCMAADGPVVLRGNSDVKRTLCKLGDTEWVAAIVPLLDVPEDGV